MNTAQTTATGLDWRDIEVDDLNLPEETRNILADQGFDTLGDIDRITASGAEMDHIRNLPGMIPDAVNEIEAILNSHRAAQSDDAGQVGDDTPDAADADTADVDVMQPELTILRERDAMVRLLAAQVEHLASQWTIHKDAAANLKKKVDAKQAELCQYVQSREPAAPLFDGVKDAAPAETPVVDSAEAWRDATLEELGITGKIAELLAEHDPPLTTHGALADCSSDGWGLMTVAGIGRAKSTQIEDKLAAWWAAHPSAAEPDPKDDDDDTDTDSDTASMDEDDVLGA